MADAYFASPPPPTIGDAGPPLPSISGWSKAAKISVGIVNLTLLVDAVLAVDYIRSIRGLQAGSESLDDAIVVEERLTSFGFVLLITQVVAAALVITWLYKAAKKAEKINPGRMNNTPKWAIWGWFVPFMNLFWPYAIVKDTWHASRRSDPTAVPEGVLKTWWGLVLGSWAIDRVVARVGGPDLDGVVWAVQIALVSSALYVVAGVLLVRIIGMIEQRQADATAMTASVPAPPMPSYVLPEADQIIS